jgi:hypothetical protein
MYVVPIFTIHQISDLCYVIKKLAGLLGTITGSTQQEETEMELSNLESNLSKYVNAVVCVHSYIISR